MTKRRKPRPGDPFFTVNRIRKAMTTTHVVHYAADQDVPRTVTIRGMTFKFASATMSKLNKGGVRAVFERIA